MKDTATCILLSSIIQPPDTLGLARTLDEKSIENLEGAQIWELEATGWWSKRYKSLL